MAEDLLLHVGIRPAGGALICDDSGGNRTVRWTETLALLHKSEEIVWKRSSLQTDSKIQLYNKIAL